MAKETKLVQVRATAGRKAHVRKAPTRRKKGPTSASALRTIIRSLEKDHDAAMRTITAQSQIISNLTNEKRLIAEALERQNRYINTMLVGAEKLADTLGHVTSHMLQDGPKAFLETPRWRATPRPDGAMTGRSVGAGPNPNYAEKD